MVPTKARLFFQIKVPCGFVHYFFKDEVNVYYEASSGAQPFHCRELVKIGSLVDKANPWIIATSFYERSLKGLVMGFIDTSRQDFSVLSKRQEEPKTQIISKEEPFRQEPNTNTYH